MFFELTKKQQKMLWRILIAAGWMIGLHFVSVEGFVRFLLYLIPYGVIGYDILKKAWLLLPESVMRHEYCF